MRAILILTSIQLIGRDHSDGRPKICRRAAEEKTIRCSALFTTSTMLGGKSTWFRCQVQSIGPQYIPFARHLYYSPLVEMFLADPNDLSSANSTSCIELLVHRDQIKHVVLVTKLSKAMLSIECVFAVEGERGQFQKAQLMVCPKDLIFSGSLK